MDTPQAYFFRGEESESTTRPQTASSSAACKSVSTSSASATAVLETEVCVSSSVRPCPSVTAAPDSVNAADVDAEPAIHVKGTSVRPTPNVIYRTRQRRTLFAILCDFDSITPSEPHPEALKQLNLKFLQRSMSPVYDRLKQLFEERPVWSRAGIKSALGYSSDNLKYLLPTLGYYFIAGPWRNLWIKFGYNPREKPESFVYQTFNYRLKQSGLIKSYIDAKRNYSSYLLPYKSNAMSRKKVSVIQSNLLSSSSFSSKSITCNNGNKNSNLSKKQISEVTLPSPPCGDGSKDSATVNDNGLVIAAEEEEEAEKDDGDEIDYSLLDPDCEDNTFGDLNCGENTVEEEGESIVSDSERGGSSTAEECLREENYIYRPGCIPPYRQMFYQYCDVLVPEIQQVLERCVLETNERLCCDPRYGWLSRRAEEECRSIMGRVVEAAVRKRTAHEREQRLKATPAAASTVPAAPADTAS
ncbi:Transcription factor IIIC subunit 5 [Trinorchestia longiramus]|nr:Transcription factor IIIC subunit 5 [Trinorchestia longiramus]